MNPSYLARALPLVVLTFMGCNAETANEQCERIFSDAMDTAACLYGIQQVDVQRQTSRLEMGITPRRSALLTEVQKDCVRQYPTDSGLTTHLNKICSEAARCYVEIELSGCLQFKQLNTTNSP